MGNQLFDSFSLLHWATGVVANFWGIPLKYFFMLHFTFEIVENTRTGINFINKYFRWWPGGKTQADGILNIIGDNVSALFGWYCAYKIRPPDAGDPPCERGSGQRSCR